ncbi:MAG TPA: oxidoreductase [Solirubrobacteraceae bacterium]|nr:oxidoreductase [Solirubrobacteraceae bacterium]
MTRVAVVGPGAIGAAAAAMAHRRGVELLLCGRTPHEQLEVDGEIVPGPVLTEPAAVPGRADVVLLAVKAHQTAGAGDFLRALCGPQTVVGVLQNGVEQRALVEPLVGGATVVPAVVWLATEVIEPGRVRTHSEPRFVLPAEPAAEAIAALLDGAELADDFTAQAWRKLAVNAVAGLMALTGRRAAMFRRPDIRTLARALALETLAVARAEGADLPDSVADELQAWMDDLPDDAGTSILADREAGRELEWDARNGVVARLGARHGIATPISDVIVPLLAAASDEPRH